MDNPSTAPPVVGGTVTTEVEWAPRNGLSLGEVLALDVVQRTQPRLLHGEVHLDRLVRWVHTSELVQVATLLKGGELLLTGGLGLAEEGAAAQAAYVHQLADKQITALAIELGWSFDEIPESLVRAARERDLPLITLTNVVPFVEITEEIQRRIVHRQAQELRAHHEVQTVLNAALLREEGLSGVVHALAEVLGREIVLRSAAGEVVATAEMGNGSQGRFSSAVVSVLGKEWGTLCVAEAAGSADPMVRAALVHGPTAVALTLLRTGRALPLRQRLTGELLEDLLAGRRVSRRDLEFRAEVLGLSLPYRRPFAGFAVGEYLPEDDEIAVRAIEGAVAETGGGLVAEVGTTVLGVVVADGGPTRAQARAQSLMDRVQARLLRYGSASSPRLALGPAVDGLALVGQSLADAQSTLTLACELGTAQRAVTARGLAVDRLLAKLVGEPELRSLVEDELGELIRYDDAHGSNLLDTLWMFLVSGDSKAEVARSLHLRRQSVYQRLAKIERLVGGIEDAERRVSLTLAMKANQLLRDRGV